MTDRVRAANSGSCPTGQAEFHRLGALRGDPGRGPVRCDGCGRFIADAELERSRFEFTPLNEFGPEESAWVCPRCVEKESKQ